MTSIDMGGERELTTILLLSATEVAAIDTICLSNHLSRSHLAKSVLHRYIDDAAAVNNNGANRTLVPGEGGSSDEDVINAWREAVGNLPGATGARLELPQEEIDPFMEAWFNSGGTGNVDDAFRWALCLYILPDEPMRPPVDLRLV